MRICIREWLVLWLWFDGCNIKAEQFDAGRLCDDDHDPMFQYLFNQHPYEEYIDFDRIENVIRIVEKLKLNDLKQKSINEYFSKK